MLNEQKDENSSASVTSVTRTEVSKTVINFTGVLAVIGAVAAIMQIYELFNKDVPKLHADVHLSESFVPDGSRISFEANENALWPYVKNDALAKYCNKRTDSGGVNFYKDANNCRSVAGLTEKIDRSSKFGDDKIFRTVVDLNNSGRDTADNVKLKSSLAGHVLVKDQSDQIIVDKDILGGETIKIPSLNPSEGVKITIDTRQSALSIQSDRPLPSILYSKGKASVSTYRTVPPLFGDIADAVDGFPKIILAAIFIIICFVVTISFILIFSVATALLRGRSISSVFATEEKG